MDEIVFFPDSGAPFLAVFGGVVVLLFGAFAGLYLRRADSIDWKALLGLTVPAGLGAFLCWMALREARAVAFAPSHLVVKYAWPRGERAVPLGEIARARVVFAGTKQPSPHLEIDLRTGDTIVGEGTSRRDTVSEAETRINALVGAASRR